MNVFEFSQERPDNRFKLSYQDDSVTSLWKSGVRTNIGTSIVGSDAAVAEFNGFGWLRIKDDEFTQASPQQVNAGQPVLIRNNQLGQAPSNRLKERFSEAVMWANNRLQVRDQSDVLVVRLDFMAKSFVQNNSFKVHLDIAGSVGVIQNDRRYFPFSAGVNELFTINYLIYQLDTFQANGGGFFITAENSCAIWDTSFLIAPLSSGVTL